MQLTCWLVQPTLPVPPPPGANSAPPLTLLPPGPPMLLMLLAKPCVKLPMDALNALKFDAACDIAVPPPTPTPPPPMPPPAIGPAAALLGPGEGTLLDASCSVGPRRRWRCANSSPCSFLVKPCRGSMGARCRLECQLRNAAPSPQTVLLLCQRQTAATCRVPLLNSTARGWLHAHAGLLHNVQGSCACMPHLHAVRGCASSRSARWLKVRREMHPIPLTPTAHTLSSHRRRKSCGERALAGMSRI